MRVLLVEDERYIAEALQQMLKKSNYSVDLAFDGEYGLDCALSGIYDIIVLDIMLPKLDGLTVLRSLREQGLDAPVLLLTARGQAEDKVRGLDLGADDYLAKPFDTQELLARLRALGRRRAVIAQDGRMRFGDLTLNPQNLILECAQAQQRLTLKESQLLEMLMARQNAVVAKESIIEKLWGYDAEAIDNNVENHVSLLRRKLRALSTAVSIQAIRGAGYILIEGKEET